jgi:hypothetical protein
MTRKNPSEFEREELKYECGFCKAPPGEWCHNIRNRKTTDLLHTDRVRSAWTTFLKKG